MIRRTITLAVAVVAAFALIACTSDNGSPGPVDATGTPDAPVTSTPAVPGTGGTGPTGPTGPTGTTEPGTNVPPPVAPDGRRLEVAPIDGLDVLVLESAPPQYMAAVQYGLPSGCAQYAGTEVQRNGDVITITVWNTQPSDENVACTMIYGMGEENVNLGSDFQSGTTYTVKAGDREVTFTAQ
ncbi:MAG: hypothetical protein O2798_11030 [Chloroflexi bacterium]|nr:hypothetical protein [Chloroflexota bacterium]MDA1241354.1 hypothetical protein [Chloroflexota bacterium]